MTTDPAIRPATLAALALRRFPAGPGSVVLACPDCAAAETAAVTDGTNGADLLDLARRLGPTCAHRNAVARPDEDPTRELRGTHDNLVEPADDRRWTRATAAALLDRTAAALLARPHTPVARLDVGPVPRPAAESAATSGVVGFGTVHEAVRRQALRTPDGAAVLTPTGPVTYRDLVAGAAGVAAALAERGVRGTVALDLDPHDASGAEATLVLGVLAAGAAYAPLDRRSPRARLTAMVRAARPSLLVTDRDLGLDVPTVRPADLLAVPGEPGPAWSDGDPDAPAYVMFTSGSTGTPKGVVVSHGAVLRLATADIVPPDLRCGRFLRAAPLAFDASTFELWVPLLHGGSVVPLGGPAADLDLVAARLRAAEVTVAWLTAGMFQQVCDLDPTVFAPLRALVTGGDVVRPDAVAAVLAAVPGLVVVNGYGPTENTTFTTTHTVASAAAATARRRLPIGRPLAGDVAIVLGPDGEPVPQGLAGELTVAGPGVALGYLDGTGGIDASGPFGTLDHAGRTLRSYRTGDVVAVLPDGELDFLGRADGQVKHRGFRVETAEIEAALTALPGVRHAAAALVPGTDGAALLAAVVPDTPNGTNPGALRDALRARLPEYMVPDRIVAVSALPLGPTGKVDRARLAGIAAGTQSTSDDPVRAAITRVLGHSDFADDDNLLERGLHSLRAFRLLRELRSLNATISLRHVMTGSSVTRLRRVVEGERA